MPVQPKMERVRMSERVFLVDFTGVSPLVWVYHSTYDYDTMIRGVFYYFIIFYYVLNRLRGKN